MRTLLFVVFLMAPAGMTAQQPGRDVLQRQIVERLVENFRVQAGLNDEQVGQFRAVFQRQFRERRELEARQRQLVSAMESQLRPGVAADVDSLTVLLSALSAHRQAFVDLEDRYQAEYRSFLSPIQQAQLVLSLTRFQRQIDNLLRRRAAENRLN